MFSLVSIFFKNCFTCLHFKQVHEVVLKITKFSISVEAKMVQKLWFVSGQIKHVWTSSYNRIISGVSKILQCRLISKRVRHFFVVYQFLSTSVLKFPSVYSITCLNRKRILSWISAQSWKSQLRNFLALEWVMKALLSPLLYHSIAISTTSVLSTLRKNECM